MLKLKKIKCVYVAGSYSADNVLQVFNNMRIGIRASMDVLFNGYAPFVPWLDYQFQLMLRDDEILTVQDFYNYSMAWLEKSDAVFVLPNSDKSIGTQREIERAKELKIPIVYSLKELKQLS